MCGCLFVYVQYIQYESIYNIYLQHTLSWFLVYFFLNDDVLLFGVFNDCWSNCCDIFFDDDVIGSFEDGGNLIVDKCCEFVDWFDFTDKSERYDCTDDADGEFLGFFDLRLFAEDTLWLSLFCT